MAFTSTLLPLAVPAPACQVYAASSGTSDSGGDTSVSCHSGSTRPGPAARTLTLSRRRQGNLGFSLRGGREHGTGFFVSAVERGSEAYLQGLMVGDQIIRVNGLPVEDATHREVLHLIQSQINVTLKVRSVGMIPIKDSSQDSLTWRLVEPEPGGGEGGEPPDPLRTSCPTAHLFINVAPKAKLGCGICKGPEWKPGIFVQFTKENSLARGAGLRPGDQIVQCNNVVFTPDTAFSEAVSILRCSGVLELVVVKGAGVDLFPGESSGYNSSASSLAGDQSPDTWPHKRLSVVREESLLDTESRLSGERSKDSDRPVHPSQFSVKPQTTDGPCTVIRVGPDTENEKTPCTKLAEICMVSQQLETKTTTVLVEVHQSGDEETTNNQSDSSLCQLTNSSSVSSFSSNASAGANSLCSAISQELQRRSEKRAKEGPSDLRPPKVDLHKCGMDKEKVEQHQQLMEEFRRAHKKMFAHTLGEENKTEPNRTCALSSKEERESFRVKRQQKEEQYAVNMSQERALVAVKERDLRLERDKQDTTETERELLRLGRRQSSCVPPPPPPMPSDDLDSKPTNGFVPLEATLPPFPPDTPTPDYDQTSLASEASSTIRKPKTVAHKAVNGSKNGNADFVEMQSLESFKLTNPEVSKPKPPPIYFPPNAHNTVSSTSSKSSEVKPTITIREYPKSNERKNPERFQFLGHNGTSLGSDEPITARLQDELTQTLSKANLKCDTSPTNESAPQRPSGKNTVTISISAQPNPQKMENGTKQPPFFLHNKNDSTGKENQRRISTTVISPSFTNGKNEEIIGKNCVSFNMGQGRDGKSVTVVQPNGILKNGLAANVGQIQTNPPVKSPCKSIKFAGISTAEVQEPKK
ncbi:uncharacterized protein LOC128988555 isoform X1 [Macrosteles quadrilineatus]|uniref:uncharacterized protein LOC128988555 isoform X1 n=1 Tax=Macrosteles quadrilineatus TaxID=74068 RepID=UPI0023E1521C|nr:uncharacterized protein LOC128988555 isoform X1 [Macrosteles quadrilineatus]